MIRLVLLKLTVLITKKECVLQCDSIDLTISFGLFIDDHADIKETE